MVFRSPYPEVPPLSDVNVHDFLCNQPGRIPPNDYVLHIDGLTGESRTRAEFLDRTRDSATGLSLPVHEGGPGIGGEGEIVGIFSHNSLEYITLVHACLVLATPFALLSAYSTPYELAHALRTSTATRLFVGLELLPIAFQAARNVGFPDDRIYLLNGHVKGRNSLADFIDNAQDRRAARIPVKAAKKDTLAYLVFSSGTTGLPKAVMVTHGNICYTIMQNDICVKLAGRLPAATTPIGLAFLPVYHAYGLHMIVFRGFWAPLTHIVIPKWDVDLVLDLIPKFRMNILYLVPSALHQLVHHKRLRPETLRTVMEIVCGAAHLSPSLVEKLKNLIKASPEFSVSNGYGMSEVTIGAARQPLPYMCEPTPDSVGVLLPSMEGKIVREDGSEAGVGEAGELWLKGENVVPGYWNNEEATRKIFSDGWLKTGDQLRVDELGRLFFVDRAKDTLKVSGVQVSPSEIETLLLAHPDGLIVDACVGGVSGGRTSDEKVPRAWVVLSEEGQREGRQRALQKLEQWTRSNLSKYKWLRGGIDTVDEIPKSPTGKVLRRVLQDGYEQARQHLRARL